MEVFIYSSISIIFRYNLLPSAVTFIKASAMKDYFGGMKGRQYDMFKIKGNLSRQISLSKTQLKFKNIRSRTIRSFIQIWKIIKRNGIISSAAQVVPFPD